MIYTKEVENMCPVAKGAKHEPAPIPEEGKWVHSKKIEDISGFTHGVGWCAPQQGACKLSLNVKNGVIEEALVETIGCSGMTHSAAMAGAIVTLDARTTGNAIDNPEILKVIVAAGADGSFRLDEEATDNVWCSTTFAYKWGDEAVLTITPEKTKKRISCGNKGGTYPP